MTHPAGPAPGRPHAWHLDADALGAYAAGTSSPVLAASAEQHLIRCEDCRLALSGVLDLAHLDRVWQQVSAQVTAPPVSRLERLLMRLGVPESEALLLWAAPAFRTSWQASILLTLLFSFWAAVLSETRGLTLFLLVAPLLPVAGVALAYGPDADEIHELTVAAPYSSLRLLLLRTLAVLVTTMPVTVVLGMLLDPAMPPPAWLMPSLSCVTLTLACSTWVGVTRAASGVGVVWLAVVAGLSGPRLDDPLPVLATESLASYAVVGVAAALVLWARSHHLNQIGASR